MAERRVTLTPQELRILELRAQEKSIAEIAEHLVIEEATVKFHLSNIYDKLGLRHIQSRSARLLKIQRYYQDLHQVSDIQDSTPQQVEEPTPEIQSEAAPEATPQALILVLEDEIELIQQSTAIQPAVIPIPPYEEQSTAYTYKPTRRWSALSILTAAVIVGIFIGAAIAKLFFGFQSGAQTSPTLRASTLPVEQPSPTTIARSLPISSSVVLSPTVISSEPAKQKSLCGERTITQYTVNPTFLRHDGVSIFTVEDSGGAILNNHVRTLTLDERGLWIGYLATKDNRSSGMGLYTKAAWINCNQTAGITSKNVNDIKIDKNGKIWVATEQSGISVFDGDQWRTYTTDNGLPSNAIFGLTLDDKGSIWAATLEGVAEFDGKKWEVPYSAENNTLVTNKVHALAFDSSGNIWVGHIEAGVSEYDNANGIWKYYTAAPGGLGGNQIRKIVVLKANTNPPESIWFATADGGVSKFTQGSWTVFRVEDGLPSNTVIDVAIDKYNRIWAATSKGVAYLEGTRWVTYNTLNTLAIAFGPTCQACPIDDEHIWTATAGNGLTHSRIPHLNNDEVIKVEGICFELIATREENCVKWQETEISHTHAISATYPTPLAPGDKFRFKITVSLHAPYQLREDRGDFLSNTDASDNNLFSAWEHIAVTGIIEPGQPYTFVENHYPFVAPVFSANEHDGVLTTTWRVWMQTRYVGPLLQLHFRVRKFSQ